MTKCLLDAVFIPALSGGKLCHGDVIRDLRDVYRATYFPVDDIAALIAMVTETMLTASGNVYYIGSGSSGCMGLIDASEMVDTYGSRLDEVRAFVVDGWTDCCNSDGDLSEKGTPFRISARDFEEVILPSLKAGVFVIIRKKPANNIWKSENCSRPALVI